MKRGYSAANIEKKRFLRLHIEHFDPVLRHTKCFVCVEAILESTQNQLFGDINLITSITLPIDLRTIHNKVHGKRLATDAPSSNT